MSKSRLEKFLYALYSLDSSDLPIPRSRIEVLYSCLVTGVDVPSFEPLSRVEKYLMAILGVYDVDSLPNPLSRVEVLLYKLATGDDNLDDIESFLSRHEELLVEIIRNGGINGDISFDDDYEYRGYSFATQQYTLENTAEQPVKSAILKGNTGYRDIDTGEFLETFEEGRNLELVSVKMPVLSTIGKNLFDGKFTKYEGVYGYYYLNNGTYTCSITDNDTSVDVSNLSFGVSDEDGFVWLFDEGTHYYNKRTITDGKIMFYPNTEEAFNKIKQRYHIQIEEGTVATTYEPHKSNILTVNEPVELRGIGEVRDELNLLTGELTERIGEVVLDGSEDENWVFWNSNVENVTGFYLNNVIEDARAYSHLVICNSLPSIDIAITGLNKENIFVSTSKKINLNISNTKATSVNELRNYLSQNPLTVQYQLATPIVKTVDISTVNQYGNDTKLKTFNDITHVTLSSEGLVPESEIEVAKYIPYMTYELTEKETTLYNTKEHSVKSAILSGQTLVNLAGKKREYIQNNANLYGWEFMLPYNLTSGKTYLAIFDVSGTIDESNSKVYLMDKRFNSMSGNTSSTVPTFSLGHNVVKCIATNDIHKVLRIRTTYNENEKFTVSNVMLIEYQEGMENWDIPYFEGMKSVNLYPDQKVSKITWKSGQYYNDNGELTTDGGNTNHRYFDEYVEIHPNHVYTISGNNNYKNLNFYDANKNHVLKVSGRSLWGDGSVKDDLYATAPTNAKYMRYNMAIDSNMDEGTTIFDTTLGIPLMKTSITETYFHKMPVLKTTGKNLFDGFNNYDTFVNGVYYKNLTRTNRLTSNVYLSSGEYTLTSKYKKATSFGQSIGFSVGDEEFTFLSTSTTTPDEGEKSVIFTVTNGGYFSIFIGTAGYGFGLYLSNVQIEKGSTTTPYEPYKSNILTVNEDVVLRGIGEVQDELNLLTGEVVQNVGEFVLNGSETGWRLSSGNTNDLRYGALLSDANVKLWSKTLNDTFVDGDMSKTDILNYVYGAGSTNGIIVTVDKNNLEIKDINGFKTWLSQNPITVQYQLATESIKTVDLSTVNQDGNDTKLSTFNDITHVTLSSEGLIPEAELEVATKNEEVLNTMSLEMDDISTTQNALQETSNAQSENVDSTMIATTEIYEGLL